MISDDGKVTVSSISYDCEKHTLPRVEPTLSLSQLSDGSGTVVTNVQLHPWMTRTVHLYPIAACNSKDASFNAGMPVT